MLCRAILLLFLNSPEEQSSVGSRVYQNWHFACSLWTRQRILVFEGTSTSWAQTLAPHHGLGHLKWVRCLRLFSLKNVVYKHIYVDSRKMVCVCILNHFSCVWLFVTLWTVACQALLSVEFSRQEYWSRLPCPPPGDLSWFRNWTHIS